MALGVGSTIREIFGALPKRKQRGLGGTRGSKPADSLGEYNKNRRPIITGSRMSFMNAARNASGGAPGAVDKYNASREAKSKREFEANQSALKRASASKEAESTREFNAKEGALDRSADLKKSREQINATASEGALNRASEIDKLNTQIKATTSTNENRLGFDKFKLLQDQSEASKERKLKKEMNKVRSNAIMHQGQGQGTPTDKDLQDLVRLTKG